LFPVPYEWGRLGRVVLTAAVLVGAGELLLPTDGLVGLATRALLWIAYPAALLLGGFFTREERSRLSSLRHPAELLARLRAAQVTPASVDGGVPEAYEAELMDEDARR